MAPFRARGQEAVFGYINADFFEARIKESELIFEMKDAFSISTTCSSSIPDLCSSITFFAPLPVDQHATMMAIFVKGNAIL